MIRSREIRALDHRRIATRRVTPLDELLAQPGDEAARRASFRAAASVSGRVACTCPYALLWLVSGGQLIEERPLRGLGKQRPLVLRGKMRVRHDHPKGDLTGVRGGDEVAHVLRRDTSSP